MVRLKLSRELCVNWHNRLFLMVTLAIAVRLLLLLAIMQNSTVFAWLNRGDSIGYTQLAQNLLRHGVYRFDGGEPTAFRMPGYPILLAFLYVLRIGDLGVRLLQIFMDAATVVLTFFAGSKAVKSEFAPFMATLFVALNPIMALTSLTLLPDTASTTLSAALLVLVVMSRHPVATSTVRWILLVVSGAILILLKPSLLLFVVSLLCLYLYRLAIEMSTQQVIRCVLEACLIFGLFFGPWIIRNYNQFGQFVPLTTSSGVNLYAGNNPDANGGFVSALPMVMPSMTEVESDRFFRHLGRQWIIENPLEFVKLLPQKLARHLSPFAFGTDSSPVVSSRLLSAFLVAMTGGFYIFAGLGIVMLVQTQEWFNVGLFLIVLVAVMIPSLIAFGATRFALPSFPAIAILAAVGVTAIIDHAGINKSQ